MSPAISASLYGNTSVRVVHGAATFDGLSVNGSGADLGVAFELINHSLSFSAFANASEALGVPALPPFDLGSASSQAFDCHSSPEQLQLLAGWPPRVRLLDADGVVASSETGAALQTYIELSGSGLTPVGRPTYASRGVWSFEGDPLAGAPSELFDSILALVWVANVSSDCCELRIDSEGYDIQALVVASLRVVRHLAHNTGRQPAYGVGDTIEITFNVRTNRAGFAVGKVLQQHEIDRLIIFEPPIGDRTDGYSARWVTDCTLLIRCDLATGEAPQVGISTIRFRDDHYELRDKDRQLRSGSTALSPPLSGTFGAAAGGSGRLDPLRASMADGSLARYVPSELVSSTSLRVGPLAWHPIVPYYATGQLGGVSECDIDAE